MKTAPKIMTIAERHELALKACRTHLLEAVRKTAQKREENAFLKHTILQKKDLTSYAVAIIRST